MTPDELNKALSDRIDSVMSTHFQNAKKQGSRYQMGDLDGAEGASCGVFRGRGGVFIATDKGDSINILNLLHRKLGGTWAETLVEAKKICGVTDVRPVAKAEKPKPRPIRKEGIRGTELLKYLNERGIKENIAVKYKVEQIDRSKLPPTKMDRWNEKYACFPFWDSEGAPVMYKWKGLQKDKMGRREIGTTFPQYATLWGWHVTDANTKSIIITEGEEDALSVAQMCPNIPALSLPNGAEKFHWIDNDFDRLQQFEEIFLFPDMDKPGEQTAQGMAKRLGLTRCRRISLPSGYKDANEFLLSKEHGKPTFEQLLEDAKTYDPAEMVGADQLLDKALDRQLEVQEALKDRNFVFPEMDFKFMPKDSGILTGYIGHGKTDFATQMMLNEIKHGEIFCIFACDTPTEDLLSLCATQMFMHDPTPIELESALKELHGKLFLVDGVEYPQTTESVLRNMEYAVRRFGVTRFHIDNLSEIADIRKDDYDKQGQFVRMIDKFDKREKTNTTIIAHALMSGDSCDWRIPGRRDVEGDKGMVKPIQFGMSIFRNKVKEKPQEFEDGDKTPKRIQKLLDGSDAYLSIWKQRNGFREEFEAGLRYDKQARLFAPQFKRLVSPYPMTATQQTETGEYGERASQNDAFTDIDVPF